MFIVAIILFGMLAGGFAQLLLGLVSGRKTTSIDWPLAFATGLAGSFVGGLAESLISGNGFAIRPSGMLWSIAGAVICSLGYVAWRRRTQ